MDEKIDFVVTWVDGNDQKWRAEKNKYTSNERKSQTDDSDIRYKDWGLFRYWFRGVEKYAPWVNRVFLITYGHLPEWLNVNNPKLVVINHKDYIPEKYLPTFNSNVIELNIHRIKELSENFVLFNDDMYIIKETKKEDFFKENIACDTAALNVHCPIKSNFIQNICNNNVAIINEHFNFKETFKKNIKIWFNLKNEKLIFRTFALFNCPRYPGFWIDHLPVSHKKSIFKEIWDLEYDVLDNTSCNKFRDATDVNHWLMKEWRVASGEMVNRRPSKFGKAFFMKKENLETTGKELLAYMTKPIGCTICINDSGSTGDEYELFIPKIVEKFEKILPEKSSFEK